MYDSVYQIEAPSCSSIPVKSKINCRDDGRVKNIMNRLPTTAHGTTKKYSSMVMHEKIK